MSVQSWIRRGFKNGVSVVDSLASGMGAGDTSFLFTDGSTFPTTNFIVTVDQGKSSEEKILVSARSGTGGTVATGGRGYNGTTAASHLSGASVLHTIDQQDLDEANQVAHATLGAIAAKGDMLSGSAVNALVKTSVGADGTVLQALASAPGGVAWGAAAGTVIAQHQYAPSTTSINLTASSFTPLDATNLTISFVVPASGQVTLKASLYMFAQVVAGSGSTAQVLLRFLNHSGGSAVSSPEAVLQLGAAGGSTNVQSAGRVIYEALVTGLTPGAPMQLDLAYTAALTGSASAIASFDNTNDGPALLTVAVA